MDESAQQKIAVIGGGLMGHGIAYLFAAAGHHVNVFEPFADVRASLSRRLQAIVDLLGDDPRLLERIAAHESLDGATRGAAWVFEAGEGFRKWTPEQADAVRGRLSRFLAEQAKSRRKNSAGSRSDCVP
jgi:3-hydroxyacyl-CoA dehydrogenase